MPVALQHIHCTYLGELSNKCARMRRNMHHKNLTQENSRVIIKLWEVNGIMRHGIIFKKKPLFFEFLTFLWGFILMPSKCRTMEFEMWNFKFHALRPLGKSQSGLPLVFPCEPGRWPVDHLPARLVKYLNLNFAQFENRTSEEVEQRITCVTADYDFDWKYPSDGRP